MFDRDAILSAQGLNAAKIDIVQQIDAFALSRFDDKSRDIARRQGFLQRPEIVEWTCTAAGNEDAEAILEDRIAIDRKSTIGLAMKGVIAIEQCGFAW